MTTVEPELVEEMFVQEASGSGNTDGELTLTGLSPSTPPATETTDLRPLGRRRSAVSVRSAPLPENLGLFCFELGFCERT